MKLMCRRGMRLGRIPEARSSWMGKRALASTAASEQWGVTVSETGSSFLQNIVSTDVHHTLADEPTKLGGSNTGPNPYQFLLASLGTCTSMTCRMYAQRKGIPLERVTVKLRHNRVYAKDCEECTSATGMVDVIQMSVQLDGNQMTQQQRDSLQSIAQRCPVHKTLVSETRIAMTFDGDNGVEEASE